MGKRYSAETITDTELEELFLELWETSKYLEDLPDELRQPFCEAACRSVLDLDYGYRIAKSFGEEFGIPRKEADSLFNTLQMIWSQNQHWAKQSRYEFWVYNGPDDDATGPLCRRLVDKVLTREEMLKVDCERPELLHIMRGGVDCRHHWAPVEKEWFTPAEWRAARSKLPFKSS
jgi:hypothetical protein